MGGTACVVGPTVGPMSQPATRNRCPSPGDLHTVTRLVPPRPQADRRPVRPSSTPAARPERSVWPRLVAIAAVAVAALAGCGGGDDDLNLSPAAAEGRAIAQEAGCVSCHGADGGGQVGPAWKGLAGSTVALADGTTVTADTEYLTRSITEPDAELVEGYTIRMPTNTLTADEVASVVAYIEELR